MNCYLFESTGQRRNRHRNDEKNRTEHAQSNHFIPLCKTQSTFYLRDMIDVFLHHEKALTKNTSKQEQKNQFSHSNDLTFKAKKIHICK